MKHIFISLAAALCLFSFIITQTLPADLTPAAAPTALKAVSEANPGSEQAAATFSEKNINTQIGMILTKSDDLQTVRMVNAFKAALGPEYSLRIVDSAESSETQRVTFQKMIEAGNKVIFLELFSAGDAQWYIEKAHENDVSLIISGVKPRKEDLLKYPNMYFIGFKSYDIIPELANEIYRYRQNNPTLMDFYDTYTEDFTYSVFSHESFEESGRADALNMVLANMGISSNIIIDSVVQHFNYNLHRQLDNSIIYKSELLLFENSTDVALTLDYFNDPTEFTRYPKQQLAMISIDDGTEELIENGDILFAVGPNAKLLGENAAQLAMTLLNGSEPSFDVMQINPTDDRYYLYNNSVLRADIEPEDAGEPPAPMVPVADEDSEEE